MSQINISNQFYSYIFDIIDSKICKAEEASPEITHKVILIVNFDHKALKAICIPKTYNYPNIIEKLPSNLQEKENIAEEIYIILGT